MSLQAIAFVAAILLRSWALLELVFVVSRRARATVVVEPEAGPRTEDVR